MLVSLRSSVEHALKRPLEGSTQKLIRVLQRDREREIVTVRMADTSFAGWPGSSSGFNAARWLKPLILCLAVGLTAFATGLWLAYKPFALTLVPGSPVAVTKDGAIETRDRAFIGRLLHDLNGQPPDASTGAGSCFADGGTTAHLQFNYANGDRLSVDVFYPCGASAIAAYTPSLKATIDSSLINDLNNWPSPTGS